MNGNGIFSHVKSKNGKYRKKALCVGVLLRIHTLRANKNELKIYFPPETTNKTKTTRKWNMIRDDIGEEKRAIHMIQQENKKKTLHLHHEMK